MMERFYKSIEQLKAFNYSHKTLHHRCLTGSLKNLWNYNIYETKFDFIPVSYQVFFSSEQEITRIVLSNFIYNPGHNILGL